MAARRSLVAVLGLGILAGCVSPGASLTVPESQAPTPTPLGTTAWPAFPQHVVATGEPGWQAVTTGAITTDGRYLTLDARSGQVFLALWPPDYTINRDPAVEITAPDGRTLRPGQELEFHGGELRSSDEAMLLELLDGQLPPAECQRPSYWVITGFGPIGGN